MDARSNRKHAEMREKYEVLPVNFGLKDVQRWIEGVTRARNADLDDFNNQESTNVRVFDVPSGSSDIKGTEKVGDIAADASYLYVVAENSGTLVWRRVSISSF